jgi:hypothetical protein
VLPLPTATDVSHPYTSAAWRASLLPGWLGHGLDRRMSAVSPSSFLFRHDYLIKIVMLIVTLKSQARYRRGERWIQRFCVVQVDSLALLFIHNNAKWKS